MQLQIRQVFEDIRIFKEAIDEIGFIADNGAVYKGFPSIANWTSGTIVLTINTSYDADNIRQRLSAYGIQMDGFNKGQHVRFITKAGDDIIFVLHKAMAEQKLQDKINRLLSQVTDLNDDVDQLIDQLPHVRRGAFSRNVNKFKHQVEVLKNIREMHKQENQR